jgi:hypothetical protein
MPEIKHTFLAGKMNKSLDDRLVPEGEYRDAQNIEVTTDIFGGGDIGTVRRVKGNDALTTTDAYFSGTPEVIGSFFDDKNDAIYYFVTDDSKHKIYKYKSGTLSTIAQDDNDDFLKFRKTNKITGVNVLEDQLLWTDNLNTPAIIDLAKVDSDATFYTTNTSIDKISILKFSPYLAPSITALANDNNISSDYIREKFVRFSYRFKFENNEYSQLAPFSEIAFKQEDDTLSGADVELAYKNGRLDNFYNYANKVSLRITLPTSPKTLHRIAAVEILLKDANSPSVRVVAKKDIISDTTIITHDYKSELPTSTLPEQQLVRVSENAPVKALAQDIVSNRVVYGNITLNRDVPDFNFTVGTDGKASDFSTIVQHSVKSRRTYELGVVLADKYGRKSPVITLPNSSVYVDPKDNSFNVDTWNGDCLTLTFTDSDSVDWGDWYSYRVVVKQPEQEYYNVYVPGGGEYNGKTYISLLGDNVNKVPRNTDNVYEGDFARSDVRLYPKVINKSTYAAVFPPFTITNGEIESIAYSIKNSSSAPYGDAFFTNYTSAEIQKFNGDDFTQVNLTGYIDLAVDPAFTNCGSDGEFYCNTPDSVYVFVNGKFKNSNDYTFVGNAGTNNAGRLTFDEMPAAADKIDVILKFDDFSINGTGGGQTTIVINALVTPSAVIGGSVTAGAATNVSLSVADSNPFSENYTLTNASQIQSDAGYISVGRIGTLSQFSELPLSEIPDSDDVGFYKENPSNLIAELNDTTNIVGLKQKAVDLAVFETEPFESALDIYYETSTSGLLENITQDSAIKINYFNTFIVKGDQTGTDNWYLEESRLYGDFNKDSVDYGVIAHVVDDIYQENVLENTLIYSGIFNSRTSFNALNQFSSSENITKSLDIQYGSIQKLFSEDSDLTVFQEEKVSRIPIDRDIIYTAEGAPQVTTSNLVLGDVMHYAGNFGIGTNPESFAYYAGRKYFVDEPKGAVLRLSRDGITEISNYGMRTHILQNIENSSSIYGMWDMRKRQYILSYVNSSLTNGYETLAFDESSNGWVSFYSYQPEFGGSLDGSFYTFKQGLLYKQYHDGSDRFYTDSSDFTASIDIVMNQNPSASKNFLTINYEGTNTWNISSIETDIDSAQDISAYDNTKEDTDNGIYLSIFRSFDGKYHANIINDSEVEPNEISFGSSMSGVKGYFMKLKAESTNSDAELFSVSTNYNINSY